MKIKNKLYSLALLLIICAVHALKSDTNQPIIIVADTAAFNHPQGLSIYQGHVKVTQGTSVLTGDKLITYTDKKNALKTLIASGNPATYETQPDNKPILKTQGSTIKYAPNEHTIELLGAAHAEQATNKIDGPHLVYNIVEQSLSSPLIQQGRTRIVIMPQTLMKPHEHA